MPSPSESSAGAEQLLKPLSGESTVGQDLRDSSQLNSFSKLQKVIREDRRYQVKAGHEGTPASWVDVQRRASEILEQESKDLEVAVWLARALVKNTGLEGLRVGLELVRELHTRFGDSLHPRDPDVRRSRLEWLDEQVGADLKAIPVPDGSNREEAAAFARSLQTGSTDIVATINSLKGLYGEKPPAFRCIRHAIDFLTGDIQDTGEAEGASAPASSGEASTGASFAVPQPRTGPRSRDEALRMLESVAAYFEAAEPLSPVPHLLRRAARWARSSLQQWLIEMVGHEDQLETIFKTLDLTKPVPKE